jgi:hypothetical protein
MMNTKSSWNIYRTRFLVRARQLTEPLRFSDSLGREHSGQIGDYLVEFSDGICRITTQVLFEDIYVPFEPPQCASSDVTVRDLPSNSALTGSAGSAISKSAKSATGRPAARASAENHFRATA